jgi:hypothetical protein
MEEEHRRILREALLKKPRKRLSFKDYLLQMPDVGPDDLFERPLDTGREVEFVVAHNGVKLLNPFAPAG